jgi:hypothetical protein
MRVLNALQSVLAGTHDTHWWGSALWSSLASVLVATVCAGMGFRILAAVFLWTASAFLVIAVIGIAAATSARLKETANA